MSDTPTPTAAEAIYADHEATIRRRLAEGYSPQPFDDARWLLLRLDQARAALAASRASGTADQRVALAWLIQAVFGEFGGVKHLEEVASQDGNYMSTVVPVSITVTNDQARHILAAFGATPAPEPVRRVEPNAARRCAEGFAQYLALRSVVLHEAEVRTLAGMIEAAPTTPAPAAGPGAPAAEMAAIGAAVVLAEAVVAHEDALIREAGRRGDADPEEQAENDAEIDQAARERSAALDAYRTARLPGRSAGPGAAPDEDDAALFLILDAVVKADDRLRGMEPATAQVADLLWLKSVIGSARIDIERLFPIARRPAPRGEGA